MPTTPTQSSPHRAEQFKGRLTDVLDLAARYGLNQSDVASIVGVETSHTSRWEKTGVGIVRVTEEVMGLCRPFGVKPKSMWTDKLEFTDESPFLIAAKRSAAWRNLLDNHDKLDALLESRDAALVVSLIHSLSEKFAHGE
ncbi:hypothetical protein [Planctomycetes bacterium Pan216]